MRACGHAVQIHTPEFLMFEMAHLLVFVSAMFYVLHGVVWALLMGRIKRKWDRMQNIGEQYKSLLSFQASLVKPDPCVDGVRRSCCFGQELPCGAQREARR